MLKCLLVRSMPWLVFPALLLALQVAPEPVVNAAPNGEATRLLRSPTVSATQIAFAYANNIWVVERSGGLARRLTTFQGQTTSPRFSPDGRSIAFSGEYAGNTDVYVVPAEGGDPKRLTWHPGADTVQGWTPDGAAILFASGRASWAPNAAARFWTVPASGGVEEPMPLPRGYQGKISPAGSHIAYRMNSSWDEERRNYRGGQNRPIWIVDLKTYDLVSPPWTDSKDMDPVWSGDSVYFLSDRDGVSNVWAFETKAKKLTQMTKFTDFDVKTIDAGAGAIVFEQAGRIHALDPKTGRSQVVEIAARGDFPWMMPRWEDVTSRISNISLSPTGRRVVVEARGEIFTIPAEKGDIRNLTNSSGSAEREPAWSPDGKWVSYFSDKSGEYKLVHRITGRSGAAARDRHRQSEALLHAVVVARLEEDALQRHRPQGLGARRGERAGQGRRPRSVDGAAADLESGLEPGLEVGRVRESTEHALPRDLRQQRRDR